MACIPPTLEGWVYIIPIHGPLDALYTWAQYTPTCWNHLQHFSISFVFPSNSPPQACNSDLFSGDIFPHLLNLVVNHIDNIKVKAHDSEFLTRFSYDHMSTRDFRLCVIDS